MTFPKTWIEHVYKEANQCADALAKLGAEFSAMFIYFDLPPNVVVNLLTLDRTATSCNRLIAVVGQCLIYYPFNQKKKKKVQR